GVLFSLHLKATMMKVSDPILFGHAVRAFFPTLFSEFGEQLGTAGLSPHHGLGAILAGVDDLDASRRCGAQAAVAQHLAAGPARTWRWSTPTRASPISTSPPTSSSTPRCRR